MANSATATPATGARTQGAQTTTWVIDPAHSNVGFSVKHLMIATVRGSFTQVQGTVKLDERDPTTAEIDITIPTASVTTRDEKRDAHLRSPDFFDVAESPTIAFRSTRVEPVNPLSRDRWRVVGDLTMHGVTRPVELAVEQTGGGSDLLDAEVAPFAATTKISRRDSGIGLNLPLEKGEFVIGDDVKIAIDVQVVEGPIGGR